MNNIIIFSVDNKDDLKLEQKRTALYRLLNKYGIIFTMCQGVYFNVRELSYIVSIEHESLVKAICTLTNQESYLKVGDDGMASLVYLNGNLVPLCEFKQVSKDTTLKHNSYTYIPHNDSYWIAE